MGGVGVCVNVKVPVSLFDFFVDGGVSVLEI